VKAEVGDDEVLRRRSVCLWLARLATYRAGLVQRLLADHRAAASTAGSPELSLDALIACSAVELADRIAARSKGRPRGAREPGDEARRFADILGEGPETPPCSDTWVIRREECATALDEVHIVTWCDDLYPARLRQTADPPPALFVRGCCAPESLRSLDGSPVVAIVGSRAPSPYGLEMTTTLARGLALAGCIVISGLALGIDAAAQDEALGVMGGTRVPATVAVLGCGVDVVYPRSNATLYARTLKQGLLVSEFDLGASPRSWRFPARNRVIAGLADAVVVVEGTVRSGSLHTAEFAVDAGRDVFAVPGEAGRRLSAGPHKLLRLGAALCEGAADVLDVLLPAWRSQGTAPASLGGAIENGQDDSRPSRRDTTRAVALSLTPAQQVLRALADCELTTDSLVARCGLSVADTAAAVSALEVEGVIRTAPGGVHVIVRR
jgi:DNA processing protein